MMFNNFFNITLLFISLLTINNCNALVVGSDSTPSRATFTTFPAADVDNTILGFAVMDQGFFLADQTTSLTYNDFFPVNFTIGLNGGTTFLSEDFQVGGYCELVSSGSIQGNTHTFSCQKQTEEIMFPYAGQLSQLAFQSVAATFWSIDWSPDNLYVLLGTNQSKELVSYWNSVSNTLTATADIVSGRPNQAVWHPTATAPYYFAAAEVTGLRTYSFTAAAGISLLDIKESGTQMTAVAWAPTGTYLAVSKNLAIEEVAVYSVSAGIMTKVTGNNISGSVLPLTSGLAWDNTGRYLALAATNNNIYLFNYNGAALNLVQTVAVGQTVQSLAWSHDGAFLMVGLSTGTNYIFLYGFSGSTLVQKNWPMVAETTDPVVGMSWATDDSFVSYVMSDGTLNFLRTMIVDRNRQRLVVASIAQPLGDAARSRVAMNHLENFNDLSTIRIAAGEADATVWGIPDYPYTFSSTTLVFDNDVNVRQSLYFAGNCYLTTNGNEMSLNNKSIVLMPGATLSIYDTVLNGIGGESAIQFLDNTATLSLAHVTLTTTGDLSIQGTWDIVGDVTISGTHTITYATNRQSTIYANSTLLLDSGITFSYYPSGAATNLLVMEDSTAELHFYQVTSYIQSAGLVLTNGTLTIEGECPLNAGGGLYLQDGNPAHDVVLNVLPESGIRIMSGSLYR